MFVFINITLLLVPRNFVLYLKHPLALASASLYVHVSTNVPGQKVSENQLVHEFK